MAQLAPLATVVGAATTLYAGQQQARAQRSNAAAQAGQAQAGAEARAAQLAAEQAEEARAREARLARTTASVRARLAAGGVAPDGGSASALTAGLEREAATAQASSDSAFAARLAAGRRSLLREDGSLNTWLRAGNALAGGLRNLLD